MLDYFLGNFIFALIAQTVGGHRLFLKPLINYFNEVKKKIKINDKGIFGKECIFRIFGFVRRTSICLPDFL